MSTLISDRKSRIKQLACASFEVAPDQMNDETDFVEDLGVDSLNAIDLLAALETEFEIEIEPESIRRMTSVGAVYELVAEVAGWPADENAASR
jgi:acyl carrier protein